MQDDAVRRRARDEDASFLVRAPAGSGKTELLTQRFLRLLATVDEPEALLALTFTRKAAGEMRQRVLDRLATSEEAWAIAARARDQDRGWNLAANPSRLRILTLDALAMHLVGRMPWLTRLGGMPQPSESVERLYLESAARVMGAGEHRDPFTLANHLHGDFDAARGLIAGMLERRDQWLPLIAGTQGDELCDAMAAEIGVQRNRDLIRLRAELPSVAPVEDTIEAWVGVVEQLLKQSGEPRSVNKQLVTTKAIAKLLHPVRELAEVRLEDDARELIATLCRLLPRAVAELRQVFAAAGECDFTEITLAAARALASPGPDGAPTDLAYRLDARLQHLFVDEFQDTSRAQHQLLAALFADWTPGDGRTLFLVGDPMQSIYGFRNAQVGQFLAVERSQGWDRLPIETLQLLCNFRSQQGLVGWCNETFERIAPGEDDAAICAVRFVGAEAVHPGERAAVIHALPSGNRRLEAEAVAGVVEGALAEPGEIAILVQSRGALEFIVPELRRRGIAYRGIKLRQLDEVPAVSDLLHLTRALYHAADRIAWLAVLRAPWIGLRLADLHALCGDEDRDGPTIAARLADGARLARLSDDGRQRLGPAAEVLLAAMAESRRQPARAVVAWAWRALGGAELLDAAELDTPDLTLVAPYGRLAPWLRSPAADARSAQSVSKLPRGDAEAFFNILEACDKRGELMPGCYALTKALEKSRSAVEGDAEARVLIMSAHEAKGLEFDTVLLPGLDREPQAPGAPLLRSIEYPGEDGSGRFLLAPPPVRGGESQLYRWLGRRIEQRAAAERLRLLYVSTTRAKRGLHLFACCPKFAKDGELASPRRRAALAHLWPVLEDEFRRQQLAATADADKAPLVASEADLTPEFRRVPAGWRPSPSAPDVVWQGDALGAPPSDVADVPLHTASAANRRLGVDVHAALQRLGGMEAAARADFIAMLSPAVAAPVRRALADRRGQWILAEHAEAHNEWQLTGWVDGALLDAKIDRSFIADGVRWIVDYKMATHEGADLEAFLCEQLEKHRPQLEIYGRLAAALDGALPVRCALYFPLLGAWRELPA